MKKQIDIETEIESLLDAQEKLLNAESTLITIKSPQLQKQRLDEVQTLYTEFTRKKESLVRKLKRMAAHSTM